MKSINEYKDMVNEVSRILWTFKELDNMPADTLKSWRPETICEYANGVMNFDAAYHIKNELLGDAPDNAILLRRLQVVDFELSQKAQWQPSFSYIWDANIFTCPYTEDGKPVIAIKLGNEEVAYMGAGLPMYEELAKVNGKVWAQEIMQQLERLARALNFRAKEVGELLDSLHEFAGSGKKQADNEQQEQILSCKLPNKKVSELFATLDDYNSFFDDGDLLNCAGWARKAWRYSKESKLYLTLRGDRKLLYDEIKKSHPNIAELDTFTKTLNNLYKSTL